MATINKACPCPPLPFSLPSNEKGTQPAQLALCALLLLLPLCDLLLLAHSNMHSRPSPSVLLLQFMRAGELFCLSSSLWLQRAIRALMLNFYNNFHADRMNVGAREGRGKAKGGLAVTVGVVPGLLWLGVAQVRRESDEPQRKQMREVTESQRSRCSRLPACAQAVIGDNPQHGQRGPCLAPLMCRFY